MAKIKLNEYISRADGTAGTLLIPKLIMPALIEEVEKNLVPRELAARVWGPSEVKGSSFTINLEAPDTLDVRTVGEGAEVPLDNIDFNTVTFTPVKIGVAIRITREMIEDSQFELLNRNISTAGRRFAEDETNRILGALDTANATVAGGAAITIANIAEAMYNVENNDYMPTDFLVGNEVAQDLRNIDTFVEADKAGNTSMMSNGFIGTIFGLNVVRFSTNAGSNAVATSSYVFDRRQAYGIAIARDVTIENFTLPTYDMEGAVLTRRIDVQALRTKAISKITTA
jgi:HK97 family phage major capsid protein